MAEKEAKFSAAQWKKMDFAVWWAASDLDIAIRPFIQQMLKAGIKKSAIKPTVLMVARKQLYFTATDAADELGHTIPESWNAKAQGTRVWKMVDARALEVCRQP